MANQSHNLSPDITDFMLQTEQRPKYPRRKRYLKRPVENINLIPKFNIAQIREENRIDVAKLQRKLHKERSERRFNNLYVVSGKRHHQNETFGEPN